MIDIFEPLRYEIPQPVPQEISTILEGSIEKYATSKISCRHYIGIAESFARFAKKNPRNVHVDYVSRKTAEIYEYVSDLHPDETLIRVDYFLASRLMVGVYIREKEAKLIGCIRGYRADMMTEDEFHRLWYGSSDNDHDPEK